jgi:hypothetical protein
MHITLNSKPAGVHRRLLRSVLTCHFPISTSYHLTILYFLVFPSNYCPASLLLAAIELEGMEEEHHEGHLYDNHVFLCDRNRNL